jgi:hypothetical protein
MVVVVRGSQSTPDHNDPQILVGFLFEGPPKIIVMKKNANQKKRSPNKKYKGQSVRISSEMLS